jgi:hypothetical protein
MHAHRTFHMILQFPSFISGGGTRNVIQSPHMEFDASGFGN